MTDEAAIQMYPEFTDLIENSAEEPEAADDYPITNLAKTTDQVFPGSVEDRAHTVRRYLERYTREIHQLYNVFEPFSEREYLYNYEEYEQYLNTLFVKVRKITGEESIVWETSAVDELMEEIKMSGPIFHFKLSEPEMDPATGQMKQSEPVKVPGFETPDAIPGSTTTLIPMSAEELKGTGEISCNAVDVPRIHLVVSVGDTLLYERYLPIEDYPIVPVMNVHLRTPFPESDVRIYRPLQEYINKIRSLIIAHASTSTNVKLLIPRGSVDKRQVEEEWGRAGTSVIEFDAELGAPIVAGPVPLPNELYKNEADAKSDLE